MAIESLRRGLPASDADFDQLYPEPVRRASARFWTPVAVAVAVSRMLAPSRSARVLDVGAGVGKLCIVGALSTGAHFTGIEQRPALVAAGRRAIERLGLRNATLLEGGLDAIDWGAYEALYLYNPFQENLYAPDDQLDQTVFLSPERFDHDVGVVDRALWAAPIGTRVVTYHGFGGRVPWTYRMMEEATAGSDMVRLWVKVSDVEELTAERRFGEPCTGRDAGADIVAEPGGSAEACDGARGRGSTTPSRCGSP